MNDYVQQPVPPDSWHSPPQSQGVPVAFREPALPADPSQP